MHAIEVEQLGKVYSLGEDFGRYQTIREGLLRALRPRRKMERSETWALRDVSFAVAPGEVVGIIGRNGAGKTTLLRILSRITEPTTGLTRTRGSIGMLLDVGTGFHPELTGRENVQLNAALLGMKTSEIRRRFDEIVEFAEIARFIDSPVKRYSAGMQARLAFSVAAHLEPEILVVDEVLAVGDATFQRKCLGKMTSVAGEGRTVVFVSHNMTAVEALCDRAIWLDCQVRTEGAPKDVIAAYLEDGLPQMLEQTWINPETAPGNDEVRLRRASISPQESRPERITVRTPTLLEFEYWNLIAGADLTLSVSLRNSQDIEVFATGPVGGRALDRGLYRSSCMIPGDLLNDGPHRVELQIVKNEGILIQSFPDVLSFDVADSLAGRGAWYGDWPGAVRPLLEWSTERVRSGLGSREPSDS